MGFNYDSLVSEEQADLAAHVLAELMRIVCSLLLWGATKSYLDDLIFADKELAVTHGVLNLLERTGAHVFKGEDEALFVVSECFMNVLNHLFLGLATLPLYLSKRDNLISFGLRHTYLYYYLV